MRTTCVSKCLSDQVFVFNTLRSLCNQRMLPIDTKDKEILDYLHRSDGGTVQELCDLLNVTRNAVRQRIMRLESQEMLSRGQRSQSRGRPKNVYRVTEKGLHSLGEDYREIAVVLWESIIALEDTEARELLLAQVRDRLADRIRKKLGQSDSAVERLDQLASEMKSTGFNVESDHSFELPILRETNCPFPMLADVDEAICHMEREVLEQVVGAPVEFKNRCRDGHHCCEFEVQVETAGNG